MGQENKLERLSLIKSRIEEGFRLAADLRWIVEELEKYLAKEKENENCN